MTRKAVTFVWRADTLCREIRATLDRARKAKNPRVLLRQVDGMLRDLDRALQGMHDEGTDPHVLRHWKGIEATLSDAYLDLRYDRRNRR